MKHRRHLVWFITVPVMVTLVAIWALTLRHALSRPVWRDPGLEAILGSFRSTAAAAGDDFAKLQMQIDASVAALNAAVAAQAVQAATIDALRAAVQDAVNEKRAPQPTAPAESGAGE